MFEKLTPGEVLLITLVAFCLHTWILHLIIRSATRASKIIELIEKQNRLLEQLLENRELPNKPMVQKSTPLSNEGVTDLNDPETLEKLLKGLGKK